MTKLGAIWSNLGIVFRFHTGYNQIVEKNKISQIPKNNSKNVEKSIDISENAEYTNNRTSVRTSKSERGILMTNNEMELLKMIRENDNPEKALDKVLDAILFFLTVHEPCQERTLVGLQESS